MRKEFELRLAAEKSEMLKKSEELETEMRHKIELEEQKMNELLAAREKMIELLQSEKEKAESRIEEERKLFDQQFADLEGKFKDIEKEKSKVNLNPVYHVFNTWFQYNERLLSQWLQFNFKSLEV